MQNVENRQIIAGFLALCWCVEREVYLTIFGNYRAFDKMGI